GVQSVLPGHYLKIAFRRDGKRTDVTEHRYWDFDFPDAGEEENPADENRVIDEFEAIFKRAVEIRLRADVPVVGYLSGGVDSAYVLATASKLRGAPVPSFTIQVPGKGLDETDDALFNARAIGSRPTILRCNSSVIANTYPQLIASADCPVIDTSCAALWRLSQEVHHQGYKVALTGEGSDEAFGGYVWFKLRAMTYWWNMVRPGASDTVDRLFRRCIPPFKSMKELKRIDDIVGGAHAQAGLYQLVANARDRYFSRDIKDRIGEHTPYEDVPPDRA
ncbi:MAG: asparagine synthase C-terminal domain-containing protein, partial [Hyphomicrobium sp.]